MKNIVDLDEKNVHKSFILEGSLVAQLTGDTISISVSLTYLVIVAHVFMEYFEMKMRLVQSYRILKIH